MAKEKITDRFDFSIKGEDKTLVYATDFCFYVLLGTNKIDRSFSVQPVDKSNTGAADFVNIYKEDQLVAEVEVEY